MSRCVGELGVARFADAGVDPGSPRNICFFGWRQSL